MKPADEMEKGNKVVVVGGRDGKWGFQPFDLEVRRGRGKIWIFQIEPATFQNWNPSKKIQYYSNICSYITVNARLNVGVIFNLFRCSANDESSNSGWDADQPPMQHHTLRWVSQNFWRFVFCGSHSQSIISSICSIRALFDEEELINLFQCLEIEFSLCCGTKMDMVSVT